MGIDNTEELIVLEDPVKIDELIHYLKDFDFIAYDSETTGLQKDAEIIGVSVAAETHKGYYIPLSWFDPTTQGLAYGSKEVRTATIKLLEFLCTKQLIMHNAIFDVEKTDVNFKINMLEALHTDTMILAHLLNENERIGLKDLAARIFGESEKKEQEEMGASIIANGGAYTAKNKEIWKSEKYLLARYGAKDTILTLKLFYHFVPILFEQGLDRFFYEEECMPLLKTATYDLNTTGLRVDVSKFKELQASLEAEIQILEAEIQNDVFQYVKEVYPGTKPKNTFNIGASQQLAWLMFVRLGQRFGKLTDGGRDVAKDLMGKVPYSDADKRRFMELCVQNELKPHKYLKCDKALLQEYEDKYTWVKKLLQYKKAEKLLSTYVLGIQERLHYGVINPGFKQTGTKATRLSSNNPNFQNLPRDDKRVKSCIVSRPGMSFVGADYSQLEPRVFAAVTQDPVLIEAFKNGLDPYSALAMQIFPNSNCVAKKGAPNFFGDKYPAKRHVGKEAFLAFAYGTKPYKFKETVKLRAKLDLDIEECQHIRETYFESMVGVADMVKRVHEQVIFNGVVYNMFGRPRRIPDAMFIKKLDWKNPIDLPYEYRTLLNLAVNYEVQGTAGSIVNRSAIAFCRRAKELGLNAKIVMQVHDEIIAECPDGQAVQVAALLKDCMENTVQLPEVDLIAEPKIAHNLADLK